MLNHGQQHMDFAIDQLLVTLLYNILDTKIYIVILDCLTLCCMTNVYKLGHYGITGNTYTGYQHS